MSRPSNLRLDDQLCFALYAATNTVVRAYRPLLRAIGLTYPQYLLMLVLWQDGPRPVHEIAARLALPPHALSPLLDRLERAGLVVRRHDSPDRRVVHVHPTAAGTELESAATAAQRDVACQTGLDPAALGDLRTELHDLVRRMDAGSGANPCAPVPGARRGRSARPTTSAPAQAPRRQTTPTTTTAGKAS